MTKEEELQLVKDVEFITLGESIVSFWIECSVCKEILITPLEYDMYVGKLLFEEPGDENKKIELLNKRKDFMLSVCDYHTKRTNHEGVYLQNRTRNIMCFVCKDKRNTEIFNEKAAFVKEHFETTKHKYYKFD